MSVGECVCVCVCVVGGKHETQGAGLDQAGWGGMV